MSKRREPRNSGAPASSPADVAASRRHQRLASRSRRFSEAFAEFASVVDLGELDIDPDEVFAGVRDAVRIVTWR